MAELPTPIVDWMAYRKCRVCGAVCGDPCFARSSTIVDGRPQGGRARLEWPHRVRARRTGW